MLASDTARATYAKLQRQGIPATVCRGASGDDYNFFYSDFTYWSNYCLGWVPDIRDKPRICIHCSRIKAPVREFEIKNDIDAFPKESRNSDRPLRQPPTPSKPGPSSVRQLCASSKHSNTGNKDSTNAKNKKAKVGASQKTKKRTKK